MPGRDLFQTAPNSGGSSWETLGSPTPPDFSQTSTPAVGRNADGRFELIAIGTDGGLWRRYQTAAASDDWSESSWLTMGTPPGDTFSQQSTPAIGPDLDGRLQLFAMGSSGTLYHRRQTQTGGFADWEWSDWEAFSATKFNPKAVPVLSSNADGRLELFLIANGGLAHIWETAPSNGWSGWASLTTPEFEGFLVGWNP
jgi:hypothetical protein